jgi:hypothetical protein
LPLNYLAEHLGARWLDFTIAAERSLDLARWGLVPFGAKDIKVGFANINAKAEGIDPIGVPYRIRTGVAAVRGSTTPLMVPCCGADARSCMELSRPRSSTGLLAIRTKQHR